MQELAEKGGIIEALQGALEEAGGAAASEASAGESHPEPQELAALRSVHIQVRSKS